jgi:APA family basic amino acid/polyamine antiporter
VLGVWHATAIVVGTIIGSGIFLVPQEMMRAVGSSADGLSGLDRRWCAHALRRHDLRGAGRHDAARRRGVCLSAQRLRRPARVSLHVDVVCGRQAGLHRQRHHRPGPRLGVFPAFAWLDGVVLRAPSADHLVTDLRHLCAWLITGLNYLGIKKAGDFQLFFTWLKVVLVLVITGFCFASPHGGVANFHTSFPGAQGGVEGFMVALIASLWAYDGWNDLTMVAGEVKRPERSLPIALIAGVGVVGVLYMATNAAIQYILPAARIADSAPGGGRYVGCLRPLGRIPGLGCHGAEHPRRAQRNHHVRRPRALCRGA